jgi:hypothetical protein
MGHAHDFAILDRSHGCSISDFDVVQVFLFQPAVLSIGCGFPPRSGSSMASELVCGIEASVAIRAATPKDDRIPVMSNYTRFTK